MTKYFRSATAWETLKKKVELELALCEDIAEGESPKLGDPKKLAAVEGYVLRNTLAVMEILEEDC